MLYATHIDPSEVLLMELMGALGLTEQHAVVKAVNSVMHELKVIAPQILVEVLDEFDVRWAL